MRSCHEYALDTLLYIDNELEGQALEDFRAHLELCEGCRASLGAEQALSRALHRSRPLYTAPAAFRNRVAAQCSAFQDTSGFVRVIKHILKTLVGQRILTTAGAAIVLCLAIVPGVLREMRAESYVDAAVTIHRQHLNGDVLSGLKSSSPEAVTAWVLSKVPFNFRLPAADSAPNTNPLYRLTGAALVKYQGSSAALLMYETQHEHDKISLLVDSSRSAVVAGGEKIQFGRLTFHFHTESGFRVITWTNHGLSYALVSNVAAPARASCLVCHQNMADRGDFGLRP